MSEYLDLTSDLLLQTKLFKPLPRLGLVKRPRLVDRLNSGLDENRQNNNARLILVCAPAGFGKTTLVSDWLTEETDSNQAWLSLEEGDNDPVRFLAYLIAALQVVLPEAGKTAAQLLQSPQPVPIETVLTLLINDISQTGQKIVLVLDDYQVITSLSIHQAMTFLIEHLPVSLHLSINTRSDPPLPLSRLRARGQLLEIRAEDLRFSLDEAGRFFNQVMGLALAQEDLLALEQRTEGWIAGLQLVGLSMQGRENLPEFIAAFTGSNRFILDYLTDEVLAQRPKGSKKFLLQTSILSRLCGPLCDAVTGQSEGQATLELLEETNLFLIPMDDKRHWYRYHHLFAEVLQRRLQKEQSSNLSDLHNRASAWLESNGLIHEAINHAVAGENFDQAAHLIERIHGEKWQTGEMKTLQSWMESLPNISWQAHPRLWLVQAWAAMTVGDFDRADDLLQGAERALSSMNEGSSGDLAAELLGFRASYASLIQDPQAITLAQMALQELPADYWLRGMLVVFLAAAYYSLGDLNAASNTLAPALAANPSNAGLRPHQIHLLAFSGMVEHARGNLQKARALVFQALALAEPGGKPIPYIGTLMAYMAASLVLFEVGEFDLVELYLNRCYTLAASFDSAEVQIFALSRLLHLHLVLDNMVTTDDYITQIDELLAAHTFNLSISSYVRYHRFQLLLKQGDLAAAADWTDPPIGWHGGLNTYALHRFAQIELSVAKKDFENALLKLKTLSKEAEMSGHVALLVKALILQTLVLKSLGYSNQAQNILTRALTSGEPQGFVGSFVEEGTPLRLLIMNYRKTLRANRDPSDNKVRRQLAYTEKLLAKFPLQESNAEPLYSSYLDPLSARELEVLGLIASGSSNRQIAETLYLAVPTVKKHVSNILSKLHAASRTKAVAEARSLGLL